MSSSSLKPSSSSSSFIECQPAAGLPSFYSLVAESINLNLKGEDRARAREKEIKVHSYPNGDFAGLVATTIRAGENSTYRDEERKSKR